MDEDIRRILLMSDRWFMRPKGRPIPGPATSKKKVDTSNVERHISGFLKKEAKMTVPSGGLGDWPTDCPVRIQVERVMGTFRHETAGDATGLLGHIISQDFYTHGVGAGLQVVTKLYRDPKAMVIEVDGVEVYRWIQNRDDLPSRLREQIIEEMRVGAVWAEMVDLQPGDEVLPGEVDGTYTIIRYDEELPLEEDDDEIIWD